MIVVFGAHGRYAADHVEDVHREVYRLERGAMQQAEHAANGDRPDFLTFGGLMHIFADYEYGRGVVQTHWHLHKVRLPIEPAARLASFLAISAVACMSYNHSLSSSPPSQSEKIRLRRSSNYMYNGMRKVILIGR